MQHDSLTNETPITDVKALFAQPPGPWPAGWEGMPNVGQAFREMFDAASSLTPPTPEWKVDRGIVICAGGWRFFASLYVTVRMIRHVGCKLPIQVWYLGDRGEFDERMCQALERFDVGWVDGNAYAREHATRRILGGWELKPFAAAYCPYREVISLDADCYPVYNPEEFMQHSEYQRVGASFWPDQGSLEPGQWERFGLSSHDEPAFESGQFMIDKSRHWEPLWLTVWLNDHSDYVYHHVYGDKDTFHLAWRKAKHECCIPTNRPGWDTVAFLQMDFDGNPLFVHRCRDKFRWADGDIDGTSIGDVNWYMTSQNSVNRFVPSLPHEQFAHDMLLESSELLRPELHFQCRPDTCDRGIFIEVGLQNEYRLPPEFQPDDVIVDVGGHIGAFAHACLVRGAGKVIVCEPEPDNLRLLRENLSQWDDRVEIIPAAVWPACKQFRGLAPPENSANTCQHSLVFGENGIEVDTISLSEVVRRAGGKTRLLKLDCEGSEYAILEDSDLSGVEEVCGEAHATRWRGRDWDGGDIEGLLGVTWNVEVEQNGPTTSLFWA